MSWIRVLDTPSCYERGAIVWAERKSVRPLAPLVGTVEPCAQRRSASAHVHQRLASHGNHSFLLHCYVRIFKILSLRSSWILVVCETSEWFVWRSVGLEFKNSKWSASLLACSWIYPFFFNTEVGQVLLAITQVTQGVGLLELSGSFTVGYVYWPIYIPPPPPKKKYLSMR